MKSAIRARIFRMAVVLVAANLAWRAVRYFLAMPIWGDEAFVADNLLSRGWSDMVRPLEYGQFVPLLFMWIELGISKVLGFSECAVRLFPFLCGLASMLLLWQFAARTLDRRAALLAIGIFAASYYPVRHAAEVKPYAGDLLAALVLIHLAWSLYQRPGSAARWLCLIVLTAAGIWFSYPSVFVSGAIGLFMLGLACRSRSKRLLAACCLYGAVLAASFALMYLTYARPQREAAVWITDIPTWKSAFPPLAQPWRLPLWLLDVHTGNMLAYPVGGKYGGSTLTLLLVLVGSVAAWRRCRPVLWLLLGPLLLNFIAAAMQCYPYGSSARISLYMAPAFCWLAGLGLRTALAACLRPRAAVRGVQIAAGFLLLIVLAGIARDLMQPYKSLADRNNRQTIRLLADQAKPHDRWIVFQGLRPCDYAPEIASYGGFGARFRFYVSTLAPVPVSWAPPPDHLPANPAATTWFIVYRGYYRSFPEQQVVEYVKALTTRLGEPDRQTYILDDIERIEVYRFAGQAP